MGQSERHSPHDSPSPSTADVEVSELTLDEDEFATAFGSLTTQFDDIDLGPKQPNDPWSSRRRID